MDNYYASLKDIAKLEVGWLEETQINLGIEPETHLVAPDMGQQNRADFWDPIFDIVNPGEGQAGL